MRDSRGMGGRARDRMGLALAALCFLLGPASAESPYHVQATAQAGAVPDGIKYQGKLETDEYTINGPTTMEFRLYDAQTGGNLLWDSGALTVEFQLGIFEADLDIPADVLSGTAGKYLELQVETETLAPRDPLRSVPYAKVAETIEGSLDISTGGLTIESQLGTALYVSSMTGRVGIGSVSPHGPVQISTVSPGAVAYGLALMNPSGAAGTGQQLFFNFDGSGAPNSYASIEAARSGTAGDAYLALRTRAGTSLAERVRVDQDGDLGVGLVNPARAVDVSGVAYFTGLLETGDGSEAAPAVTMGGDADTGLFLPGAGILGASTGGTERLRITSGGVGVSSVPAAGYKLVVDGGDFMVGSPAAAQASGEEDLLVGGNAVAEGVLYQTGGTQNRFEDLAVGTRTIPGQLFKVGAGLFTVESGGDVGIGLTDPAANLDVEGGAQLGAAPDKSTFTASGALVLVAGASITFAGGGTAMGLPLATSDDEAASKDYVAYFIGQNTGWVKSGLVVRLGLAGDDVGIDSLSPAAKLEVRGDARFGSAGTQSAATAAGGIQVYDDMTTGGSLSAGGSVTLPGNSISPAEVGFVYAGSSSQGGPATSLSNDVVWGAKLALSPCDDLEIYKKVAGTWQCAADDDSAPISEAVADGYVYDTTNNQPSGNWNVTAGAGEDTDFDGTFYIEHNTGDVGIGTTNPGRKLDVSGTATVSQGITVTGNFNAGAYTLTVNGSLGNTMHACTVRQTTSNSAGVSRDCVGNERVTGGGGSCGGGTILNESYPLDNNTWRVTCSAADSSNTAYAVCCLY